MICGQGTAPQAATIAAYRELGLDLVPGTGLLAAVVPGAFDAWMLLLRDYGTLPLREVLGPAIALRRASGYPLVPVISATIERVRDAVRRPSGRPRPRSICRAARCRQPGSLFRNPALADTYARILEEAASAGGEREAQIEAARRAWYQGFVAEAIDRFCRTQAVMDTSGRRHRGLLTGDDLAALAGDGRGAAHLRLSRLHLVQARPLEPGAGGPAAARPARGLRPRRALGRGPGVRPYWWPNAPSSPSPTARRFTAIRTSSRCRSRRCSRTPTTRARAGWSASGPRASCGRAPIEGYGGAIPLHARTGDARTSRMPARWRRWRLGVGEPTVARGTMAAELDGPRRHLPSRRDRPARQHGRGDAVGRLAAELAGDPGARLLPQHARRRCSGSRRACPRAWRPASGRAPRSRPRSRCATASRTWRSARRAATSRTSGRCTSSCATSISA